MGESVPEFHTTSLIDGRPWSYASWETHVPSEGYHMYALDVYVGTRMYYPDDRDDAVPIRWEDGSVTELRDWSELRANRILQYLERDL